MRSRSMMPASATRCRTASGPATHRALRMALLAITTFFVGIAATITSSAQDTKDIHNICKDSCCQTDVLLLNTGYDHFNNQPYTVPASDAFWHVITDPAGGPVPRAADVIPSAPPWAPAQFNSQWIGGVPSPRDPSLGGTVYEKCFCVCGDRPMVYTIDLNILSDDSATVFVDGAPIGNTPQMGFGTPTPIHTIVKLTPGVHCIEVEVDNIFPVQAGFDLVGTIQGQGLVRYNCCNNAFIDPPDKCETPKLTIVTDDSWTLQSGPQDGTVYPRCADIVTQPNHAWSAPIPGTNWIGPNNTGTSHGGDYVYHKCFCLTKPATVTITMSSMADDQAEGYLDGVQVTNAGPFSGPPNTNTIIVALDAGCHCFDFVVHDLGFVVSGLDAQIDISGPHIARPECCDCGNCKNGGGGDQPLLRTQGGNPAISGQAASRTLMMAIPNPTNGVTTLRYSLATAMDVSLDLYDASGKHVRSLDAGSRQQGSHDITVDAKSLPSGAYFVVLTMDKRAFTLPLTVQ
ncbi:MAG: T9SS type A sorting domain-containing protein [Bacteroidetes bacterium]|nr:T9SS type A sorting domain-containing protein [Bacteroidota bacterium]